MPRPGGLQVTQEQGDRGQDRVAGRRIGEPPAVGEIRPMREPTGRHIDSAETGTGRVEGVRDDVRRAHPGLLQP